jgi:hypothetical protein
VRCLLFALWLLVSGVALAQATPPPTPAQTDPNAAVVKQYLFNTPFSQLDNLVVADPVRWVAQAGAPLARAKIGETLQRFALILCFTGFLWGIWRARAHGNLAAYGQVFVRFVVASVLVGISLNMNGTRKDWNISAFVFSAWTNGYGWAIAQFGDDVDAALIEAQDALGDTISQVTIAAVSLTGARIGVQGFRAAAKATLAGEGAAGAGAAAGKAVTAGVSKSASALLGKLRWTLGSFMPLMQAYAGVIYGSGIVLTLGLYLLPLAFAMIVWGQARLVFMNLMLLFTAIMTVTLVPWIFAVGVKLAFVQPNQAIRYYNDQLAVTRDQAQRNTAAVKAQIAETGRTLTDDCKAAIAADPSGKAEEEDPACRAMRGGTWLENMTSGLVNTLTQNLGIISDAINGLINAVNTLVIAMIAVMIGMGLGLLLIVSLPLILANYLGVNWPGKL